MTDRNFNDFSKPHLPTKKTGYFTGERGDSAFIPNNQEVREMMQSFGVDSVNYVKGYPDFSPFTLIQDERLGRINGRVEIGHMTTNRKNPQYAYGRRTDSHAANEDLGNFSQADNELAKFLNARDGTELTGKDIQEMRERNKLTWHEVEDGKTMCLVPTQIHDACPHSGGVSVEKDLYQIANSEDYDFDTGEYNAMDYTYDEERDELIPVNHDKVSKSDYIPKEDEYAFTGKVDANPQYGNGGGTQFFIPYANEMKQEGRLVLRDVQVEDKSARTGSGETKLVKEYTDEKGIHTILDHRPMDPDELQELAESCPESEEEAIKQAETPEEVSKEEPAISPEDMPSDEFYQNLDDEYKHPLTNQENSGGLYSADAWAEPVKLKPGEVYYQISINGDTKSPYFTDRTTVDSCLREDGSINYEVLREKLQIGNPEDKVTLTAYVFRPALEGEKTTIISPADPMTREADEKAAGGTSDVPPNTTPDTPPLDGEPVKENTAASAAEPAQAKNIRMIDPGDIDMTYAMGMDSEQFWNHHGNTKEDYIQIAEKIPDVQKELDSGKTLEEIRKNPELQPTVHAYFDPNNMVKVEVNQDGSYSFIDDGRHRVMAAMECGSQIPVKVENMPETVEQHSVQDHAGPPEMKTADMTANLPLDTVFDSNGRPLDEDETKRYRAAMNNMADYLSEHNYGPEDYETYSRDPAWQKLNNELQESLGMEPTEYPQTKESVETRYRDAMNNMADYLGSHNYGREDYGTYSKDPEWQKLNEELIEAIKQKDEFVDNTNGEAAEERKESQEPEETEESQKSEETEESQEAEEVRESQEPEEIEESQEPEETEESQKSEETEESQESEETEESQKPEETEKSQKTEETEKPEEPVETDGSQIIGKTEDVSTADLTEELKIKVEGTGPELPLDDLTIEDQPGVEPLNGDGTLPEDDLNMEGDLNSQTDRPIVIDSTTIFDDMGNPLLKEEQEAYYTALNDLADYHSQHDDTQLDYDRYSQDPQWQKLNQKLEESMEPLTKDDLNIEKKKETKDMEALDQDDLATGDPNLDNPEKNKVEEPPKVDIPENTDGGDSGGNRR